ncbi:MAG TPA: response regulator [Candidatus Bathyarchaeia archaeon]|nr:response regulator [Candidatus Bathyarchaeia archaeon]
MKLLLIEDNHDVSKMVSQYLRLKGYDCMVADNGKDGLDQIINGKYDVVLLDLAMPEFSGYDVIASLEAKGKLVDQKLIILTVYALSDEKIKGLESRGVYACIKKPVQLQELVKTIQSCTSSQN